MFRSPYFPIKVLFYLLFNYYRTNKFRIYFERFLVNYFLETEHFSHLSSLVTLLSNIPILCFVVCRWNGDEKCLFLKNVKKTLEGYLSAFKKFYELCKIAPDFSALQSQLPC